MIPISSLLITQEIIRNCCQLSGMAKHVREGGLWTKEVLANYAKEIGCKVGPLITITKFPDGVLLLHDGHHRTTSTYLGGRSYLSPEEYVILNHPYEDYLEINFQTGWITPFDPRIEVRLPDFFAFKNEVFALAEKDIEEAVAFVRANKSKYARPRSIKTVIELAATCRGFV